MAGDDQNPESQKPDAQGRKGSKKGRPGSSLTDAVVAALAQVDPPKADEPPRVGESPPAAEAGCASTHTGTNGFRNGPGSFADLMRRWSGLSGAVTPSAVTPSAVTPSAAPPSAAPASATASDEDVAARREPSRAPEPPRVTEPPVDPVSSGSSEPPSVEARESQPEEPSASEPPVVEEKPAPAAAIAPVGVADVDPAGPVEVRYFGRTDVGLVREHNEDNFLVADLAGKTRNPEAPIDGKVASNGCVFAICDGMGGAAAGEVASQMAVDTIYEVMGAGAAASRDDFARRLVTAVEEAGQRIFSAAKMDRSRRGMGTTATVAGLVDNVLFVGQVGDSRAYVLRNGQFQQITKDQSLVNQLIEAGQLTEEEAEAFEHSNIILQALGTTEEVTVDLTFLEVRRGDRMMMCSDGLSGLVHGDMIKEVLEATPDQVDATGKLIQMANAGGGHDNISVIVVDFDGAGLSDDVSAPVRYQQYPLPPSEDHRKSLPPRPTSMKPGAQKPGADVKQGAYAHAATDEAPPSGGSNTMIYVMILALVFLGAAGAWYLWGDALTGTGAVDDGPVEPPPPPPPNPDDLGTTDPDPVDDPTNGDPNGEPNVEPIPELERGTIHLRSDVEEGDLYINGQLHGPLASEMNIELEPGGYTLEARNGETRIGQISVTVTAGGVAEAELSVPVGEDGPGPTADDPPTNSGRSGGASGRSTRGSGRRTGGEGSGGGGRANGALPSNPF
ncbi:MAG: Stp1/IreP family PP2C-type Ser/Thr phosphatase [Sandaracinaceae bacterium]